MALEQTYEDEYGGVHTTAYHKIIETNINWLEKKGRLVIATWASKAARDAGKRFLTSKGYAIPYSAPAAQDEEPAVSSFDDVFGLGKLDPEGCNPVAAGYSWLKTLYDYEDATDA